MFILSRSYGYNKLFAQLENGIPTAEKSLEEGSLSHKER